MSTIVTAKPSFQQRLQITLNDTNEHSHYSNNLLPLQLQVTLNNTKDNIHYTTPSFQQQFQLRINNTKAQSLQKYPSSTTVTNTNI